MSSHRKNAGDILEFRKVAYRWHDKDRTLFGDLSFSLPRGKACALLGPNGAGKTTIMDLSLGWLHPTGGSILLDGRDLRHWSTRRQGRFMALVPQDETIHFDYSVTEYVLLGRAPYLPPLGSPGKGDLLMAERVLSECGIDFLAERAVSRLSGGERQLVLLARALVQEPELLLLDEPASHLDLHNRERLLAILEKLKEKRITMLFSSHDPELVLRLSDHVILLKEGRIPGSGPAEKVLTAPILSELYNVPVKKALVDGRPVLLWGAPAASAPRREAEK